MAAVAGLVLLQWVIFAAGALLPSVVLSSYLNVPVLLAVGLGRPRLTGMLAVQGLLTSTATRPATRSWPPSRNGCASRYAPTIWSPASAATSS